MMLLLTKGYSRIVKYFVIVVIKYCSTAFVTRHFNLKHTLIANFKLN